MVPPESVLGVVPTWVGVYVLSAVVFTASAVLLYRRVFRLVLMGRPGRFDRPLLRLAGALKPAFGQSKVLQSVSLRDRAGLAHAFIFWGFLSFLLSYLLFIYGDSAWPGLSATLLTDGGVRAYAIYLELLAFGFLAVLTWAAVRRWAAKPHRLSFDLTQKAESAIILLLIGLLMLLTLCSEVFFAASGGGGAASETLIGHRLGDLLAEAGLSASVAGALYQLSWWGHLGLILGFAIYIPLSQARPYRSLPSFLRHALVGAYGRTAHTGGPGDCGDLRGRKAPGLQPQGAAGRVRLRRLRPLHGSLPRPPEREDPLPHARRREP